MSAYDYLPLLDELGYVTRKLLRKGPEISRTARRSLGRYKLYDLAMFQTTVTATHWDAKAKLWRLSTDRGDKLSAQFVVVANGTWPNLKLSKIKGMGTFQGHSFHSSRFDYAYCGAS